VYYTAKPRIFGVI